MHGTVWYFSALNFLGLLFFLFFVKETKGLTDLEKKTLYSPTSTVQPQTEMASVDPFET